MMAFMQGPNALMKRRMLVCVFILCVLGSGVLIFSLFNIQIVKADEYQRMAEKQQLREVSISPQRGTIYDRNMKALAQSATAWTVVISPSDVKDEQRELIVSGLAEILEMDPETIRAKSNRKTYYEVLKSKVDRPLADEVTQFTIDNELSCIFLEEDSKRIYPYGSLASTVLGFTNADNEGAYGIESYYNKVLSGNPGKIVAAKNAWGTDMPFKYEKMYEAENGNSLVLTIDEYIQQVCEKYLDIAVEEHNVENRATCIAMDVNTGEILAMATKNDFDPNDPYTLTDAGAAEELEALEAQLDIPAAQAKLDALTEGTAEYEAAKAELQEKRDKYNTAQKNAWYDQWRNKAISDPYEPGSVFKLITASAAYETGSVKLTDHFYCPGYYKVATETIKCWKAGGHGDQDFAHAVMNSCNPAFIQIGQKLGPQNYYKYFEAFGLTEKTGVDLPGEVDNRTLYHSLEELSRATPSVELASSSFGQTFKVTPMQLITAISAAVNGGRLMEPHIVKQVVDADGNIIENVEPKVIRQVISEETSAQIAEFGRLVVAEGSGKNANVPGYRIGGKTGTSEKIDLLVQNNGLDEKYISSFLGFAPADDPQIAILLLLDEPYMANPYGSALAAPVVGKIMAEVLPYLGVEPKYTEAELATVDIATPDVVGLGTSEAGQKAAEMGLEVEVLGDGNKVLKQTPRAYATIPKGGTILLYTDFDSTTELVTVPSVVGLPAQEANTKIINAGLNIKVTGAGINGYASIAGSQSIEGGTQVEPGTVITIQFIVQEPVT